MQWRFVIAQELKAFGYDSKVKVGECGFKVDLAVINPENSSHYILGIEIDGGAHVAEDYSRDREKSRPEILKKRSWHVISIWSQEWVKDRDSLLALIVKEIQSRCELLKSA